MIPLAAVTNILSEEKLAPATLISKKREIILPARTNFNGDDGNRLSDGRLVITQEEKSGKLRLATTAKAFASERAVIQYIGVNKRPDISAATQMIAPGKEPATQKKYKMFGNTIYGIENTRENG